MMWKIASLVMCTKYNLVTVSVKDKRDLYSNVNVVYFTLLQKILGLMVD